MSTANSNIRSEVADAFLQWYENEQRKGLVDLKVFCGNLAQATTKEFFTALNGSLMPRNSKMRAFLEARSRNAF